MRPLKIIIIEDEQRAASRLEKLILEIDSSIEVVASMDSIESVLEWHEKEAQPDLYFLDIHLADGSAFEIFKRIQITQPIIFTTAYDQYAIDAFKVNAIDYLLKPIKRLELEAALKKYHSLHSSPVLDYSELLSQISKGKTTKLKRFLIRVAQNLKTVEVDNVAYFYTENKITFLTTYEGKRYSVDYSLEKLEEELEQELFFRINRQFIIRVNAISKMVAVSKSRVKIWLDPNAVETIVSTERSGKFKKWLIGQ